MSTATLKQGGNTALDQRRVDLNGALYGAVDSTEWDKVTEMLEAGIVPYFNGPEGVPEIYKPAMVHLIRGLREGKLELPWGKEKQIMQKLVDELDDPFGIIGDTRSIRPRLGGPDIYYTGGPKDFSALEALIEPVYVDSVDPQRYDNHKTRSAWLDFAHHPGAEALFLALLNKAESLEQAFPKHMTPEVLANINPSPAMVVALWEKGLPVDNVNEYVKAASAGKDPDILDRMMAFAVSEKKLTDGAVIADVQQKHPEIWEKYKDDVSARAQGRAGRHIGRISHEGSRNPFTKVADGVSARLDALGGYVEQKGKGY